MDCKANAVGSFSNCAFTVPDASPGAHIVTARDYSGNAPILRFYHSAMASYSVTPGASLDPEAGIVGRTVRVSGGNFPAGCPQNGQVGIVSAADGAVGTVHRC